MIAVSDSLAQLVEHNTFNVGVMGSSPMRVTVSEKGLSVKESPFFVSINFLSAIGGYKYGTGG